jgi:hypothetical protein
VSSFEPEERAGLEPKAANNWDFVIEEDEI